MSGDTVTPVLTDVYTALKSFIVATLGIDPALVIQGIQNRAAMPLPDAPGFVVMTAILSQRLRTNIDTWDMTTPTPTVMTAEQGTKLTVQLDCYGPVSNDWATMLSTLLRDETACIALAPTCQPLYAEDARMAPLVDAEAQYEQRWIVGAVLQYNPVTTVPLQSADTLTLDVISVDEAYPP